jgi:hypothetical protein
MNPSASGDAPNIRLSPEASYLPTTVIGLAVIGQRVLWGVRFEIFAYRAEVRVTPKSTKHNIDWG